MRKFLKKFYTEQWQTTMYYVAQAYGEYSKAARFVNESLLLSIFAKSIGFKINLWEVALFNIVMIGLARIIGKFITDLGIPAYNAKIGNSQNPEFLKIMSDIKLIKNKLGIPEE